MITDIENIAFTVEAMLAFDMPCVKQLHHDAMLELYPSEDERPLVEIFFYLMFFFFFSEFLQF